MAFTMLFANMVAAMPKKASQGTQISDLRALLQMPENRIDLAKAKLTIDHMIDPKVDVAATLQQLDTLAARIKTRFPERATSQTKLEFLATSLSQAGPWNDYRPFSYT